MTYSDYILRTGEGLARWESAFGRFLLQRYFDGCSSILDVGPGRCWFVRQRPAAITGIEIEPKLVEHFRAQGLNLLEGSVDAIPVPDQSVDGVFCCWLFEHLESPILGMSEFARVLRAGAAAVVIVPSPRTLTRTFYDDYTHIRPFTPASLSQLAVDAGFARHRVEHLAWTRAGVRLSRIWNEAALERYLRFGDVHLRRLGLVNRDNYVLTAWK